MKAVCVVAPLLIWLCIPGVQASRPTGINLKPLDPALVDDVPESSNAATRTSIRFVNQSGGPVRQEGIWIHGSDIPRGHRHHHRFQVAGLVRS